MVKINNFLNKGIILIFISLYGQAQDLIVKRNGEELLAIVISANSNQINYKLNDAPEAIMSSIPTSDVFMIKYRSGRKEVFNLNGLNNSPTIPEPNISSGNTKIKPPSKIILSNGIYYQNNFRLRSSKLYEVLLELPDDQVRSLTHKAKNESFGIILLGLGIPAILSGCIVSLLSTIPEQAQNSRNTIKHATTTSNTYVSQKSEAEIGLSILGFGTVSLVTGIIINNNCRRHTKAAVLRYNSFIQ